jgi:hypothetical protein
MIVDIDNALLIVAVYALSGIASKNDDNHDDGLDHHPSLFALCEGQGVVDLSTLGVVINLYVYFCLSFRLQGAVISEWY